MNINRDYLIINDVKKSNVKLDNGSIFFYITDKNTQNIFVNLVINVSKNDLIQKFANIENAEDYTLTMNIVKPSNTYKVIEGKLHDKENAIFEFNLNEDCCDEIGTYRCELLTKCNINDHEEITTSNKLTYKVKSSVLNDLDDIVEAPEYPLVIQLFDKLSDIEQYEEDRRANELARQLAEEQRQVRFNTLDADMTDRVTAMDDKMVDVENRVSTKEQAVDKLINDTKADIDDYKVAKDQEIDEYKTAKDTEINNAITNQDNKIDTAISEQNDRISNAIATQDNKIDTAIKSQNDRIALVENNDVAQDNRLDVLENKDVLHESRLDAIEVKNQQQDGRLDIVENKNQQQDNRLDVVEAKNVEQDNRLDEIEAIDVAQNSRLDAIEVKNQQQDDRLLDIEKVNKRQDMNLKCLFAESKNNMIDITEEGNSIYLQNSTTGYTLVDEIKGNTLVNCNKEPDKELILNGNINTSGDNTVTITEGVDGGLVDVALEGNTLVNVSKTKDSTAITKSYTVENSGNHIALQGNADGSCRPVITGKTLVNLCKLSRASKNVAILDNPTRITGTVTIINAFKSNRIYVNRQNISSNTYAGATFITSNVFKLDIPTGQYIYSIYDNTPTDYIPPSTLISDVLILEGDYTDKPIPDYFEGLQSTFEDNLVTQEMVDNGEEEEGNLGKYRVEYKVTGKNKFDLNNPQILNGGNFTVNNGSLRYYATIDELSSYNGYNSVDITLKLKPNTQYVFRHDTNITVGDSDTLGCGRVFIFKNNIHIETVMNNTPKTILTDETGVLLFKFIGNWSSTKHDFDVTFSNIQIEEGDTVTPYEPYKEATKILYLNSPLLEGDTIDNGMYHVHRSELVAYTEGDETSLITDKVNTLHQLETPQYELIEQSNLAMPSYTNGHLDFNTAVPVEKAEFKPFIEELTYLYANTQYTVQFISTRAMLADLILGGTQLLAQSIVEGLNRISITTPATLVDNKLIIDGTGANISEVVVTDTDREFGYFEGMKSVGECEELEMTSANSDNTLLNTQQLTHEPLRAVGNSKDKYVLIDGKWFIERNCQELVLNSLNVKISRMLTGSTGKYRFRLITQLGNVKEGNTIISDKFPTSTSTYLCRTGVSSGTEDGGRITFYSKQTSSMTEQQFKSWIVDNPITVVYAISQPTYEPLEYNPFEVYSDTTHITTNSAIPTNITIKNHGFNCLLKPSTTYTISSNLGLNTVTTPSTLTEDCLRFMDTDTSDVTTMKDVLVLEGDWTTKADVIPAKFSGIESAFEQEYDAEKGKYKVNIKVTNEDKSKENNITFYINEPLRGVGDAKDRVFIKDDKVVVERNCGSLVLDGSYKAPHVWSNSPGNIVNGYYNYNEVVGLPFISSNLVEIINDKLPSNIGGHISTVEGFRATEYYFTFSIHKAKLGIIDVNDSTNNENIIRQWLQQNPITVVYQLAEPTYEEVQYNDTKLFIESFKNSTLFYNSNVPVTSKLYYSYSVPIVDTVAQTANISDEQDVMIIDLATQVAVMEMLLM